MGTLQEKSLFHPVRKGRHDIHVELRTVGIGKHPAASTLFHRLRHAFGIMIGFDFETKKLFQVELGKVTFRKLLELANRVDVILLGIVYRPSCPPATRHSGSSRGALLSGLQRWAKRRSAPDMGVHSSTCKGTWFTDVSYAQRYGN